MGFVDYADANDSDSDDVGSGLRSSDSANEMDIAEKGSDCSDRDLSQRKKRKRRERGGVEEGSDDGDSDLDLHLMELEGGRADRDRDRSRKKKRRKESGGVPTSVAFSMSPQRAAKSEARTWCCKEWALEKEAEWVGNKDVGEKPPLRFIDVSDWPAEPPAVEPPLTNPETALTTMLDDEALIGTVCCKLPDVYTQYTVVSKAADGFVLIQGFLPEVGAFGSVER